MGTGGRLRRWYRSQPSWVKCVNLIAAIVVLITLINGLRKSGPEVEAIRWHHRNGDHVIVHGISFPVYFWYAPKIDEDEIDIQDDPGPLRPNDDRFTAIHISWDQDDPFAGLDRLAGLSAAQRAREKVQSYQRTGYANVQTFSRHYLDQDFVCVHELDPRFHRPYERWWSFEYYSDGPVYYIFFAGSGSAQNQFEWMLTKSERLKPVASE